MGSPCVWDGSLSPSDFHVAARALSERWKQIDPTLPQWTWIPSLKIPTGASRNEEGYLSLENVCRLKSNEERIGETSCSGIEEHTDIATLVQSYDDEKHIYDFHIVYNFSYRVPVLYFRGYQCDGQLLDLDDIQKDLSPYSIRVLRESKWTFITQEEHPYLHRPWYMLHPCGTSDWMKLLLGGTPPMKNPEILQYLPSWLSVVGQAVGLGIPLQLQK